VDRHTDGHKPLGLGLGIARRRTVGEGAHDGERSVGPPAATRALALHPRIRASPAAIGGDRARRRVSRGFVSTATDTRSGRRSQRGVTDPNG
jgi:hypothetical protein